MKIHEILNEDQAMVNLCSSMQSTIIYDRNIQLKVAQWCASNHNSIVTEEIWVHVTYSPCIEGSNQRHWRKDMKAILSLQSFICRFNWLTMYIKLLTPIASLLGKLRWCPVQENKTNTQPVQNQTLFGLLLKTILLPKDRTFPCCQVGQAAQGWWGKVL